MGPTNHELFMELGPPSYPQCAYCGESIKPGQPSVPDCCGETGSRMHIGCSAEDQDGQDLDNEFGDS